MKHILFLLIVFFPVFVFAHGFWLNVSGTGKVNEKLTIAICYGEIDVYGKRIVENGAEFKYNAAFKLYIVDSKGMRTDLPIHAVKNAWVAEYTPLKIDNYRIEAYNDSLPVVDRSNSGGKNVLPIEYLCAQYNVGNTKENILPQQYMDIISTKFNDLIKIIPYREGKICPEIKLRVFNPENWEKSLDVDAKGETLFYPNKKGLYIIRMDWYENKKGNKNGIEYVSIRHRCNYCLTIN